MKEELLSEQTLPPCESSESQRLCKQKGDESRGKENKGSEEIMQTDR